MGELKLYNTLTRKKETFSPLDASNVRMYVCGPTVYDFAHIGNARPVIVFDVLFRLLRHLYGADHVTYARNITDVDDKINARAVRDFPGLPLNEAIRKVTESTAAQFHADVKALGCLEPTHEPRATDHIPQMIDIIGRLLANGYAYIAQGGEGREVLFSVEKMPRYGELSNRKLEEQREGARVAVEAHKKSPGDFVLWKESSANEPGWNAEFTSGAEKVTIHGRPGWHIECSAMSMAKLLEPMGGGLTCDDPLKNTFDIHAGGLDLIFPHHENEIAQSCCAFGAPGKPNLLMASVWMHNGFLQVEGQKMSKSLGNFVTINELLATEKFGGRKWSGPTLRFAMLMTNYKEPLNLSVSRLIEAEIHWKNVLRLTRIVPKNYENKEVPKEFLEILMNDLSHSEAIGYMTIIHKQAKYKDVDLASKVKTMMELIGFDLSYSEELDVTEEEIQNVILDRAMAFKRGDSGHVERQREDLLLKGIRLEDRVDDKTGELKTTWESVGADTVNHEKLENIKNLITARLAARNAKNFAESDRIRDELVAMGIQIMDAKDPITGELKTTWEVKR